MKKYDRNAQRDKLAKKAGISTAVLEQVMPVSAHEGGRRSSRHERALQWYVAEGRITQEQAEAVQKAIDKEEDNRWNARKRVWGMNQEQRYMYERYSSETYLDLEDLAKETGVDLQILEDVVPRHLCHEEGRQFSRQEF